MENKDLNMIQDTNNVELTKEMFKRIPKDDEASELIARPSITFWQDVWRRLKENKASMLALFMLGLLIIMVVFGPYINGHSATKIQSSTKDLWPNSEYWFGTDVSGRDIFTRVWVAGRTSLEIGLLGAVISTLVGVIYGAISGYVGGKIDILMMRIVEVLASLPYLLVVILLQIRLDRRDLPTMLLALTITAWTGTSRIVRAEVLRIKAQEFVLAAQTLGVSGWNIIKKHLIPNAMPIVIVGITFDIPGFIFAEAFLSYLGIGLKPPDTSWGIMCSEATTSFMYLPYQMLFPSLMIAITMLCFTLLGDGLRDALDPKLRK